MTTKIILTIKREADYVRNLNLNLVRKPDATIRSVANGSGLRHFVPYIIALHLPVVNPCKYVNFTFLHLTGRYTLRWQLNQ